MSPLIQTEYNNIIIDVDARDNNNHYNHQYDYDEEFNLLQEPTNYSSSRERGNLIIKKYIYYLVIMIISVIIEVYLLSKFLPTIIDNFHIEDIDYLYE